MWHQVNGSNVISYSTNLHEWELYFRKDIIPLVAKAHPPLVEHSQIRSLLNEILYDVHMVCHGNYFFGQNGFKLISILGAMPKEFEVPLPTPKPTSDPTIKPTFQPTFVPTFPPTFDPTELPTQAPWSISPTTEPTSSPSASPTTEDCNTFCS